MANVAEVSWVRLEYLRLCVQAVTVVVAGLIYHIEVSLTVVAIAYCQPKEVHSHPISPLIRRVVLIERAVLTGVHVEDSLAGPADVKGTHTEKHLIAAGVVNAGRKVKQSRILACLVR